MRVASLPRTTPNVLWLGLYIDAGSRDADLPETATLSARLAAERAHAHITATVFPDVTELSLSCTADGLEHCVGLLALALATRRPDEADLAQARTRLRSDQRHGLAAEPDTPLDVLALHSLLGDAASGFFPLGDVRSDLVAAGAAVPQFLSQNYGPARTLLVAAGDIGPHELKAAATNAFKSVPAAARPRAVRTLVTLDRPQLEVSFEDTAAATLALAGPDESTLRDVTQRLTTVLTESEPTVVLTGNIFAARSGALALLRLQSNDCELGLEHAARALARLQREPTGMRPARVQPDDLRASAREIGLQFGAAGAEPSSGLQFGAALALSAGPDGGPADSAARADREQRRRKRAQALFAAALHQADPHLHGDIDSSVAAVELDNGARLDVQFTQGRSVAVAIRIGNGAAADPPSIHGKAALMATLTTLYCAGMGPELLHGRFAQLGASLSARVDAESYGVLVRVPKEHFKEATELALRCVRSPSRDPAHLAYASVRLQQRLRHARGQLMLRARAAELISPRAPGPLAPWGDPNHVPNLQPRELEQTVRQDAVGERWAIGVVGPVEVRDTAVWLARRLSDLGTEPQKVATHWDEPSSPLPTELPRSDGQTGTTFLAVWAAHGDFPGALGAQLFARALGALLGALPGVEVLWHDADSYRQTSFAALALRVRPELLTSAPSWLADAARSLDDAWVEAALKPAVAEAQRVRSAGQAELAVRAEQIARMRLGAVFEPATLESARAQLIALRSAQPGFAAAPSIDER